MDLLSSIKGPEDVKRLAVDEISKLAAEIRKFLIDSVSRTGGHLGSNLGVVELTIALHRIFSSPSDCLLFDTGHQAYVHKLLTGRQGKFHRLRQHGGLSGYPNRSESWHDVIENSHASTALSYADGMSKAFMLRGERHRHVVALVGDGALTGGMAWEAMNNIAVDKDRPIVIVVNDNGRSYSPTVGGFTGTMFEALGLPYIGPVDGHDIKAVEAALNHARGLGRVAVVHCLTTKGRGYPPAENDATDCLHSPGSFDKVSGRVAAGPGLTWTNVFSEELASIGAKRPDVVAITAAMLHTTGLDRFAAAFPERVFDVGIAEQHAVTSAAGLALGGAHPVVAIYSTFLNRAFDQVLMDVALHRLPVTFVLDRAGVTGDDGPSHNGMWDLSILQIIPELRIGAARDARRLRELLREAVDVTDGPTAIRFPKGAVPPDIHPVESVAGVDILARSPDLAGPPAPTAVLIVSVGAMAAVCVEAAGLVEPGIDVTVVDPQWVKPVPAVLCDLAACHQAVLVVEDNGRAGAVGDAIARRLRDDNIDVPVRTLGIPQQFHSHAKRTQILEHAGLHPRALAAAVSDLARRDRLDLRGPVNRAPHMAGEIT